MRPRPWKPTLFSRIRIAAFRPIVDRFWPQKYKKTSKSLIMEKLKMNNFANVIECLNRGGHAKRMAWQGNKEIVKQVPQCISKDIVPRMTSLPDSIKPMIGTVGFTLTNFPNWYHPYGIHVFSPLLIGDTGSVHTLHILRKHCYIFRFFHWFSEFLYFCSVKWLKLSEGRNDILARPWAGLAKASWVKVLRLFFIYIVRLFISIFDNCCFECVIVPHIGKVIFVESCKSLF